MYATTLHGVSGDQILTLGLKISHASALITLSLVMIMFNQGAVKIMSVLLQDNMNIELNPTLKIIILNIIHTDKVVNRTLTACLFLSLHATIVRLPGDLPRIFSYGMS